MLRPLSFALFLGLPAAAAALCTSEGVAQPPAVLERFINADCLACWSDPATPRPAGEALVLDWVVPGSLGEHAPLAVVATRDALDRLAQLRQAVPARSSSAQSRRSGPRAQLRLAQGATFNDYIGTSVEVPQPGREAWRAWLVLVERLPAGTEGSPVARNLVRNAFRPEWPAATARTAQRLAEARSMQIREGAAPERLRLVALLEDGRGRMRAITQTECR